MYHIFYRQPRMPYLWTEASGKPHRDLSTAIAHVRKIDRSLQTSAFVADSNDQVHYVIEIYSAEAALSL